MTGWQAARQIITFLLGVAMIIYGAVTQGHDIPFLVTGLILMGIIPVEDWLAARYPVRQRGDDTR